VPDFASVYYRHGRAIIRASGMGNSYGCQAFRWMDDTIRVNDMIQYHVGDGSDDDMMVVMKMDSPTLFARGL
jgi:hypothetical protein